MVCCWEEVVMRRRCEQLAVAGPVGWRPSGRWEARLTAVLLAFAVAGSDLKRTD